MGVPVWVAKLVGKFIGSKLNLKEDKDMADEAKKGWWKSKTVWSGVVAVAVAAYNAVSQQFNTPPIPEWIFGILGGIGVYGRVTAEKKIG